MIKKINKNNLNFNSEEFQKDKYKFYIALTILSNNNSTIYSNEKDYAVMQMSKNSPLWVWTKDNMIITILMKY